MTDVCIMCMLYNIHCVYIYNPTGMWGMQSGISNSVAFAGGAMMLFGARLASGCTRYCNCTSPNVVGVLSVSFCVFLPF